MFNLLIRLFGLHNNYLDTRPVEYPTPSFPTPSPSPSVMGPPPTNPILETLQPVKSWCHPFKDKSHPLLQLTTMAKAIAGYYPIGRNGLWHGGVHFDSGTASVLDQSSVHCLADGEVIAYRIDERSAATSYFHEGVAVERPFSRNFVLVRHCLQPPRIEGSADAPPTLIFYSLYMHLQDWAVYRDAPDLARPSFWPLGATYRVAPTASDVRLGQPEQKGLNVRNQSRQGRVIGFLQRGAQVTVSGTGDYRRLENAPGPEHLKAADGSLRGYLSVSFLEPIAVGQYRVISEDKLNLREEASSHSAVIAQLEPGTEVTISGEGEFRKLEHINQYIHFNSLLAAQEPQGVERIVVLDTPKAIKAADLIGHIGLYQDQAESEPGKKLHLEVFTDESVEAFIQASRIWAQRLPASEKTWIKLEKGTPVVPHQDNYCATQYPIPLTDGPVSGSDLLLPKSLLDGLPAERKIAVPRNNLDKSYNWYRLDGLLNDADNNLLDGWVREEVGVTPWVSPWSWEGYDILLDYDTPLNALASFFRDLGKLDEAQLERYQRMADISVQGRVKSRLYDIIDSDRDGKMTAAEVQAAISLPAHAQSISQMIIYSQSEWYKPGKWDGLDEILGHSGSTPHTNWLAEKERIKALCWWEELAGKVGLPTHGRVFHIHPVGLVGAFAYEDKFRVLAGKITFDAEGNDDASSKFYSRVIHWPGNGLSGVTLGRGYDMGSRTKSEIYLHMVQAGISEEKSLLISMAHGLKGAAADLFVKGNKALVGEITKEQQVALFNVIYPLYLARAISVYDKWTERELDRVPWLDLDPIIQDVLVDFVYQGFTTGANPMKSGMRNNREDMILYIEKTPGIYRYELGRGRASYLRNN